VRLLVARIRTTTHELSRPSQCHIKRFHVKPDLVVRPRAFSSDLPLVPSRLGFSSVDRTTLHGFFFKVNYWKTSEIVDNDVIQIKDTAKLVLLIQERECLRNQKSERSGEVQKKKCENIKQV